MRAPAGDGPSRLGRALSLASTLLLAACSQETDAWRVAAVLGPRPGATGAPTVVIDKEQRNVLVGWETHELSFPAARWDLATPGASVRAAVPAALADATRLEILPRIVRRRGMTPLPSQFLAVDRGADGSFVDVELGDLPRGQPGRLRLLARALPEEPVVSVDTEAFDVPPDARVEFGFGFLPREAPAGGATLRVLACRDGACDPVHEEEVAGGLATWLDRRVDLSRHAGGSVSLRFEARLAGDPPTNDAPVFSVPVLLVLAPRGDPPNLLLISLDTLRADHLGTYGYARDTSPFVDDELAARGTVFERSISTATTTGPSHMSMFTGLAPSIHGVHGHFDALPDGVPTLADALLEAGFVTGAVTEDGAMGGYRGFDRGFLGYYEDREGGPNGRLDGTLARSAAWLERHRGDRFFLFVHTFQVHKPYAPPDELAELFAADGVDADAVHALPDEWQPVRYDREIRYTDSRLAEFFDALGDDLLDDTLVVLLSDHGEQFLEHGALSHGPSVYEEVLRVPLIVLGPGVAAGRRVAHPVSLVDLQATLIDLLGVDSPWGVPGTSFAALARDGAAAEPRAPKPVFSEARADQAVLFRGGRVAHQKLPVPIFSVRLGDKKLIRHPEGRGGRFEYYDLARDPDEQHDLFRPGDPDVVALQALLDAHVAEAAQARSRLEAVERDETGVGALDPERREKLRALGYLD